ncbi:MAG: Asp/Glu racemase [Pseudomonadota bacterium]
MKKLNYHINPTLDQRATIGMVVLSEDETVEYEMRQLIPEPDVALHVSRVNSGEELTPDTIMQMKSDLAAAASLFPRSANFDCVAYACTSGTSMIGATAVHGQVAAACQTKAVTDPLTALIAYCRQARIKRLGFLSPYRADVSDSLRANLSKAGIETPGFGYFGEQRESAVVRIDKQSIEVASREIVATGDMQALFLSCTNLRTHSLLKQLGQELGMPIISSNAVLAWHMRVLLQLGADSF